MHMSMGKLEHVRVPVNRDPRTGRYRPQTQAFRRRHGLTLNGGGLAPLFAPASRFARTQRPVDVHLGQWAEIASAYMASKSGGGGGGGAPTAQPHGGGGGGTAISPAIQTDISPQISPAFFQAQDSAGATQAATATQYRGGGQTADTGGVTSTPTQPLPTSAPLTTTKPGGLTASPLDPVRLTDIRSFPTAGEDIARMQQSQPFNWTPVIWGAVIVGSLVVVVPLLTRRKPR